MKKLFIFLIFMLLVVNAQAGQWRNGSGENTILGTSNISDIDANSYAKMVDPLDRMLAGYREGATITYNDAASVVVTAGELMLSNAAGTIRLMVRNTASLTSTWSVADNGLDAGTEPASTIVYVYGVVDAASDTTFKIRLTTSSTAPAGFTYYKKLGSFYNNADSNISTITNDVSGVDKKLGTWASKTVGTTYQATTDGFYHALAYCGAGNKGFLTLYSDGASAPTTVRGYASCADYDTGNINPANSATIAVKAGDYYKATVTTLLGSMTNTSYFIPYN